MIEPTYDILDCGPRNRFVANGKVVHNCDSVNMQNLPSRGGPYAKVLKNCVVPPDGHMIVDCDASQIEARVLAWFAEQDDLVDAFANREDVYKKMASSIYKIPVEEVSKQQRQVGKVAILGCGYGVGGAKFKNVLKLMGGVDADEDEAKRIVTLYRETNPKIQRLWWDAGSMLERMVQGRDKQFGREGVVRVDHEENAIWLPSGLPILYPDLRVKRSDSRAEYSYKGRGKSRNYIYGGKCLAGDTEVLTDSGWIALRDVTTAHQVWDGTEWVTHGGLTFQGYKRTTVINGVRMTSDHQVLTEEGWRDASSCEGLHRAGFWLPNGDRVSGDRRETLDVEVSVRVRDRGDTGGHRRREEPAQRVRAVLWMQAREESRDPCNVQAPGVLGVAVYAGQMSATHAPSLGQLWRTGYSCLQAMGGVVRGVLGRYGTIVRAWVDARSHRQRGGLHADELQMGGLSCSSGEPEGFTAGRHSRSASKDGYFKVDAVLSVEPEPVYDLLNAGPNSRFVVRGDAGPFIVHNCVENITQALARCIIAEQMLLIQQRYRVALTVHDSVVVVVPEAEIVGGTGFIMDCMRYLPDWAAGLPIDCEAEVGYTYGNLTEFDKWLANREQ